MTPTFRANVLNPPLTPSTLSGPAIASRRTVARVWQDVLLAPVRGPEDDFFDAGGDSLNAIVLTMELEHALGLELSPTLIYEVPRFDRFCEVLRERRAPRYVPLVPLKVGVGALPVFFIHGLGGNVVDILPTARRMAYAGAVIGIRARGLTRGEAPHSSVEAMAADYLNEIRGAPTERPLSVVRLFLRWARGLRDRAAAFGSGREGRVRRPLRYDDESTEMATADLALHHRPAHWASAQEACGHVDADGTARHCLAF